MSLRKYPIVGKLVEETNKTIRDFGVQNAFKELINRSGTKLQIENKSSEIVEILKKHPVVIVANHPAEADVLALLASLEKRVDFRLIINSSFLNICESFDEYLIPVGITNRLMAKPGLKLRLRLFNKIQKQVLLSKEEEHQRNIQSINLATQKLNEGYAVTIFPGGGGEGGKWFSGIGHMICGVKEKESTFIIKAYIEGTSDWDYFRIIPGTAKVLPKFKITFDVPSRMDRFENFDPKVTAKTLEEEYNIWVKSLTNQNDSVGLLKTLVMIKNLFFRLSRVG